VISFGSLDNDFDSDPTALEMALTAFDISSITGDGTTTAAVATALSRVRDEVATGARLLGALSQPEIEMNPEDRLFRTICKTLGGAAPIIAIYNHWVQVKLPQQVVAFTYSDLTYTYTYANVVISRPQVTRGTMDSEPMLPDHARKHKDTYMATVYCDVIATPKAGPGPATIRTRRPVTKLPVMLGSVLCWLSDMNAEQLRAAGESFNDPFGYFIIKGSEKVIITQEKLAASQFITCPFDTKGKLETRITSLTTTKSSVTTMSVGKAWPTLKVHMSHIAGSATLFALFDLLFLETITGPPDVRRPQVMQTGLAMILDFIPEEHKTRAFFALQPSMTKMGAIPDSFIYMIRKRDKKRKQKRVHRRTEEAETVVTTSRERQELSREAILSDIYRDLFAHIEGPQKAVHLAIMAARTLLCLIGVRPYDNRDGWESKRVDTAAKSMEQLFNSLMVKLHEPARTKGSSQGLNDTAMTENYISCFASNSWGVKGAQGNENITDTVRRENQVAVVSLIRRCNAKASRQAKQPTIRKIQASQLSGICLAETPEGSGVGIIKNLACTAWISVERNVQAVLGHMVGLQLQPNRTEEEDTPFVVNGILMGWCNHDLTLPIAKLAKRYRDSFDVCVMFNPIDNQIEVFTDGSRICRPLLVVENDTLLIDGLVNGYDMGVFELIEAGALEYVHLREQIYIMLAQRPREVAADRRKRTEATIRLQLESETLDADQRAELVKIVERQHYTHAEVDPVAMFGEAGALIPYPQHNQGPRLTYQASMCKQSTGGYHPLHFQRFDSYKRLVAPTRPIVVTRMDELLGLDIMPTAETPIVAFMALPLNNEDAIVASEEFLARNFGIVKYSTHTASAAGNGGSVVEHFRRPEITSKSETQIALYANLDDNGIAKVGAYLKRGDCIIGRIRSTVVDGTLHQDNASIYVGVGEEGFVDRVLITTTPDLTTRVYVKMRQVRRQICGDKVASRYAQKGTFGEVRSVVNLPRIVGGPNDGVVPDLFINPHSIPSRMSIGKMYEMLASKAALYMDNPRVDATAFMPFDIQKYRDVLVANGLDANGMETMCHPDGSMIAHKVFVAPCAYQALRHHVLDKKQCRAMGGIIPVTRQPVHGRQLGGGLRTGEMERDTFLSHGAADLTLDRMMICSDQSQAEYCYNCGNMARSNQTTGVRMCPICPDSEAKFGVITMPYIAILITRMLGAMGIHTILNARAIANPTQ